MIKRNFTIDLKAIDATLTGNSNIFKGIDNHIMNFRNSNETILKIDTHNKKIIFSRKLFGEGWKFEFDDSGPIIL